MAQIAKVSLILSDANQVKGSASESWFLPYSSDPILVAAAQTLRNTRANMLGYGAVCGPTRLTVYNVNADTSLSKIKTLPTLVTTVSPSGWTGFAASTALGYFCNAALKKSSTAATFLFAGNVMANYRPFGVPFVLSWDFNPTLWAVANSAVPGTQDSAISTLFRTAVKAYKTALTTAGAFRRFLLIASKMPIGAVTISSAGNICVSVAGNQAAVFPVGTLVKIGGRHQIRTGNYFKHDPLNGTHTVLSSTYDGTSQTTICLSCSRYGSTIPECMGRNGYIGLLQHQNLALADISIPAPTAGRTRAGRR